MYLNMQYIRAVMAAGGLPVAWGLLGKLHDRI
jgi:hypothetical protein